MDELYTKYLEIIKKYDPEEYNGLMNCSYGGIVEDHLDHLIEQFPDIKDFEKAMQETVKELAEIDAEANAKE